MAEAAGNSVEKALAINLDPLKYGTIVEIGAGQEVARWFFRAGAAAGTIAKTMSAYDMDFSDEIYGPLTDKRYVSRARLERMIEREFELVISRLEARRPAGSTFFAFANTVATMGYRERDECHGWVGVRFQSAPKAPPDDIILHVRMLDDTDLEQQEALGILGVNLIHGAFFHAARPERLLESLTDNLKWGRVEIDLVVFRGPALGPVDNRSMALELVRASLARAILFDPDGEIVIPADALYKRKVLVMRRAVHPLAAQGRAMFEHAKTRFGEAHRDAGTETVYLAEMTLAGQPEGEPMNPANLLERVDALRRAGFHVLVSEFFRSFRVRQYLARYTGEEVGIVVDAAGFAEIMNEGYYDGLRGGLLEGLGQLFPPRTTAYVYPRDGAGGRVTLDTCPIAPHLEPLVSYLRERGLAIPVDDFT